MVAMLTYGGTDSSFYEDERGNRLDGVGSVWDSQIAGAQYLDTVDANGGVGGAILTAVSPKGLVQFQRPDDGVNSVWVDFGGGRVKLNANDAFMTAGGVAALYVSKWQPATVYAAGAPVLNPSGDTVKRITAGTSRPAYDATEALLWVGSGTYVSAVLPTKYGAVGDYNAAAGTGTDSTAAFQSAINEIAAQAAESRVRMVVPNGTFKISAPLTGIPKNFELVLSPRARLCYTGTGVMFDIGTYTTTPPSLWNGVTTGFIIQGGWIDVPNTTYASEGSRVPTCIRDNGNGSVTLKDTLIAGFAYGFQGAWGSDFTVFDNARFSYNDVGAYFGPGSQQVSITDGCFLGNREGLVLDRAQQGYVRTTFVDSSVADITVEYIAASVRSGVVAATGLAFNNCAWTIDCPWHESNADGSGLRIPAQHIWTKGDTAGYPQGLKVRRPFLVSGGTPSASNAFWRNDKGTRHTLEDLLVYGAQVKYAVAVGATAPTIVQRNTRQADGFTGLVLWDTETASTITIDDSTSRQQGPTGAILRSWRKTGDAFDRIQVTANGSLLMGDGTAAPVGSVAALSPTITGIGGSLRVTPLNGGTVGLDVFASAAQTVPYMRIRSSGAGLVVSEIDLNGNLHGGIFTKAGTPVDADFAVPRDGLICVDTTASKLWLRIGGTWKSATFT